MVERLLMRMVSFTINRDCDECLQSEDNRLYFKGAPCNVLPSMRDLSAEEFIAQQMREPFTAEEWVGQVQQGPPEGRAFTDSDGRVFGYISHS